MDHIERSKPTECPSCHQQTMHLIPVYEHGCLADVLVYCEDCDEENPFATM